MQITDVRVRKIAKEGKMKAVVSITLDNAFVVHDIKVLKGTEGCLSPCRAKNLWTGNTGMWHIRLIPLQGMQFRRQFWRGMRKHFQNRRKSERKMGRRYHERIWCVLPFLLRKF